MILDKLTFDLVLGKDSEKVIHAWRYAGSFDKAIVMSIRVQEVIDTITTRPILQYCTTPPATRAVVGSGTAQ